jgi:15-cis-phytoene synthase
VTGLVQPAGAPAAPAERAGFRERASIERHSRSFALASRLLPPHVGTNAAVVYAWCRRADDAIDLAGAETAERALVRLRRELGELYDGPAPADPVLSAFRAVLREKGIPWQYPADLLAGMEMDVRGQRYERLEDLLVYCYRVAATVGLMMCHVMGVNDAAALEPAAHLGLAMQLTNICRDVQEDWQLGRLYLPDELLARYGVGGLATRLGTPLSGAAAAGCRGAVRDLLDIAERYYASSDTGLGHLSWRCALGVNAARRIYSAIGTELARQDWDVRAPRAVVSGPRKLWYCVQAAATVLSRRASSRPLSMFRPFQAAPLDSVRHATELIPL